MIFCIRAVIVKISENTRSTKYYIINIVKYKSNIIGSFIFVSVSRWNLPTKVAGEVRFASIRQDPVEGAYGTHLEKPVPVQFAFVDE